MNKTYFIWLCAFLSIPYCDGSARSNLNFTELAAYDGYTAETHKVTTQDGYILTLHRLPLKSSCSSDQKKIPIIFMHGLYESSDDCLVPGPGVGHCYIYADNCTDVWAPNSRGNVYSRGHQTYNADEDNEFWDFDIDEMALEDLPVIIDYILNVTESTEVGYVAHAQGAAILLILCAKKPEYNAKISFGVGLSTTAWLDNASFSVITLEQALSPIMSFASSIGANVEVFPRGGLVQKTAQTVCGNSLSYLLCSAAIFAAFGYNGYQITNDVLIDAVGHDPCGTSLKNFNRWGMMKSNGFSEYDYGTKGNQEKYGQATPPSIDLQNVTMQWVFLGSENDNLSDLRDLDTLMSHLSNSSKCVISDKTFTHIDFLFSKNIPKYITPVVLSMLNNRSYECL